MQSKLKVGTRKSDLALTQTSQVIHSLKDKGINAEAFHIVTTGDRDQRPFRHMLGDGFFTKEIEKSLLKNEVQTAVHSSKDLPSQTHKDIPWFAYGPREEATDILIIKKEYVLSENPLQIKPDIVIGTSSPRREAQLKIKYPNAKIESFRGNVPTRIEKVKNGTVDACVLAKAGVNRLNLLRFIEEQGLKVYDLDFVTAPCQGILGLQTRAENKEFIEGVINSELTEIARAEKMVLAILGGGCHLAVGCKITKNESYELKFFFSEENQTFDFTLEAPSIDGLLRKLFDKLTNANGSKRVIITPAVQHQLRAAKIFSKHNYQVIPWVLREIKPTFSISNFEELSSKYKSFDGLVFTSQFSVRIFFNEFITRFPELLSELHKQKIYAVGDATKLEVEKYGPFSVIVPPEAHAVSMIDIIECQNALLMGSSHSAIRKLFDKQGKAYKFLNLYESFPNQGPLSGVPEFRDGDKLILSNPLCALDFIELYKKEPSDFKKVDIYAFGPSTAKVLTENNIEHVVNKRSGSWKDMAETL